MIRKGLFITRADRYLVLEYLFWTHEFLQRTLADPKGRALALISMAHQDLDTGVAELDEIRNRAEDLRQQLRLRIRSVVKAPDSNGWNPDERPSAELTEQLSRLAREVSSKQDRSAVWPHPQGWDVS